MKLLFRSRVRLLFAQPFRGLPGRKCLRIHIWCEISALGAWSSSLAAASSLRTYANEVFGFYRRSTSCSLRKSLSNEISWTATFSSNCCYWRAWARSAHYDDDDYHYHYYCYRRCSCCCCCRCTAAALLLLLLPLPLPLPLLLLLLLLLLSLLVLLSLLLPLLLLMLLLLPQLQASPAGRSALRGPQLHQMQEPRPSGM